MTDISPQEVANTLFHELGHVIHLGRTGNTEVAITRYLEAIKRDSAIPSPYGATAHWEDFAESFNLYVGRIGHWQGHTSFKGLEQKIALELWWTAPLPSEAQEA